MSMYGLAETPRPPLPLGSTKIISAMPDTQLSIKQNDWNFSYPKVQQGTDTHRVQPLFSKKNENP